MTAPTKRISSNLATLLNLPGGEEKYTRKELVRKVLDVYTERMGEGRGILERDELLFDPEMRAVLNIPSNERLYILNLSRYVSSCCLE